MDLADAVLVPLHLTEQVVDLPLGLAEHDHLGISVLDDVDEFIPLRLASGHYEVLRGQVEGRFVLGYEQLPVIDHVFHGELLDVVLHGGGEHHGLPLLRDLGKDHVHAGCESHVQHAVRLVEDYYGYRGERDLLPLQEVFEPAWGRDEDVRPFFKLFDLVLYVDSAVYGETFMAAELRQSVDLVAHLCCKLPSRHENQRRGVCTARHGFTQDDGTVCTGLSGPGLCLREEVRPL